ncbi:MAG: hypothetical protein AAGF26_15590 [Cyanobacteria bacterium P01_G01_bin.49]
MNSANTFTAQISTLSGVTIMLLNIILFIVTFCFYCYLVPTQPQAATESFDSFIPSVKRAFSTEFDPEPETTTTEVIPSPILCLPYTKPRRSNQINPIINEVIITPLNTTDFSDSPQVSPDSTYRELQQFVKNHNLQQMVKNLTGKPYNKCPKVELIKVLTA